MFGLGIWAHVAFLTCQQVLTWSGGNAVITSFVFPSVNCLTPPKAGHLLTRSMLTEKKMPVTDTCLGDLTNSPTPILWGPFGLHLFLVSTNIYECLWWAEAGTPGLHISPYSSMPRESKKDARSGLPCSCPIITKQEIETQYNKGIQSSLQKQQKVYLELESLSPAPKLVFWVLCCFLH